MERCATDAAFRMIVGEGIPDFRAASPTFAFGI